MKQQKKCARRVKSAARRHGGPLKLVGAAPGFRGGVDTRGGGSSIMLANGFHRVDRSEPTLRC